jgi:serine/threonine protein kinase
MPPSTTCPAPQRLRELLDDRLAAAEQAELTRHLDDCPRCRRELEILARGELPAQEVTAMLHGAPAGGGPATEPALDRALHQLRQPPSDAARQPGRREAWVLSFLEPPAEAGELGRLGGYRVLEVVGQGGMGIVLKALDPALGRHVAIKVLAPHLAGDDTARQRFAREARAAAAVHHENVVTIHAVAEADGLPYLVMEYVGGGSLQDYLDRHGPPDLPVVLRLAAQVAAGLAAAHGCGLVHRDIKPANILLSGIGDRGSGIEVGTRAGDLRSSILDLQSSVVKITDFGLARAAAEARLTQSGTVSGTPMYMAPEQAMGAAVDARADLFSLGSVLYRLCTGHAPFPGGNPVVTLRQVCDATPRPVRELNPAVPLWLADLIEALHAKRPEERFASAADLAAILRQQLTHLEDPALAPPSRVTLRRLRRPRRGRGWWRVGVLLLLLLVPVAALALSEAMGWTRLPVVPETWRTPVPRQVLRGHTNVAYAVAFSPDGTRLATASADFTVRLWDPVTGQERALLRKHTDVIYALAFDPQGELIASGGEDGFYLWRADGSGPPLDGFPQYGRRIRALAFAPDGQTLAVGSSGGKVELFDCAGGRLKSRGPLKGHQSAVNGLAFRPGPEATVLVSADAGGTVRVWDLNPGRQAPPLAFDQLAQGQQEELGELLPGRQDPPLAFTAHAGMIYSVGFTADGAMLATGGPNGRSKLWDARAWKQLAELQGPDCQVTAVAFSPGGRVLASGAHEGGVKLWDVSGRRLLTTLAAHHGGVWSVAFSPDGATLASGGVDRMVYLWDVSRYTAVR